MLLLCAAHQPNCVLHILLLPRVFSSIRNLRHVCGQVRSTLSDLSACMCGGPEPNNWTCSVASRKEDVHRGSGPKVALQGIWWAESQRVGGRRRPSGRFLLPFPLQLGATHTSARRAKSEWSLFVYHVGTYVHSTRKEEIGTLSTASYRSR
jgi:hypothetical protein